MKDQHKKALYIVVLLLLFGLIGATFCYFPGKTETLEEALAEFWNFGYALIPLFAIAIGLLLYDLHRLNRKNNSG